MSGRARLDRMVNSSWNYWGSLAGDTAATLFFLACAVQQYRGRWPLGLTCAAFGYVLWTAFEYLAHRLILHGPPSAARRGHTQHHRDAEALIATPLLVVPGLLVALWLLLRLLVEPGLAASFVFGAAAGYLNFGLIHHAHHHWQIDLPPLRVLRAHHELHHLRPKVNYGSTTTFWDRLFGTYASPSEVSSSRAR